MAISGKQMRKLFEEIGYKIVKGGGKGSHMKLIKQGSPMIIIPYHKELTKGMEHSLRKKLDNERKKIVTPLLNGFMHEHLS